MKLGTGESAPEAQACVRSPTSPWDSFPLCPLESGVAQDWPLLCSINQTDQMLAHLQSFSSVPEHFTLPDSTKSGVPLFYIPPGSTTPVSDSEARQPHSTPTLARTGTASGAQNHLLFPSLSSLRSLFPSSFPPPFSFPLKSQFCCPEFLSFSLESSSPPSFQVADREGSVERLSSADHGCQA